MELRPILSALLRNKTGPLLITLQIAITLAIVTNAAFIIQQRLALMDRPTGMDENNIVFVESTGFAPDYDQRGAYQTDREALLAIPGVRHVAYMNRAPLSGGGSANAFTSDPARFEEIGQSANYYSVDEHGLEALGLELAAGRWFDRSDIEFKESGDDRPATAVITRAFARDLFGDEPAVGKLMYDGLGDAIRIVGVVERMQGAWLGWDRVDRVILFGEVTMDRSLGYAIRVEPGLADRLVPQIEAKLQEINRGRVITSVRTLKDYKDKSYADDAAMVQMLIAVSALLVAVTALGMIGLAAFNVTQRRKQIGTRRALGATRGAIMQYFLIEALLLAVAGSVLGLGLAYALSWWLGVSFNLPVLDWRYLPPVVAALCLICLIAVLGPARRASRIEPALATRSV